MKLISICILFTCLIAATFNKWVLIASYEFNKKYIATELCVNRNNTVAHCNGHCFLNKQMTNQEKPGMPFSIPSSEKFSVNLFFETVSGQSFFPSQLVVSRTPIGQHLFSTPLLKAVFHPPKAL